MMSLSGANDQQATVEILLPGQTEALRTANIFARATGYVPMRRIDIGSRVGDVLAHITAPDLDQQLAQAAQVAAP
jgi:hypothetical protein